MFSLDDRPAPPAAPRFSQDMEQFLVAAARSGPPRRSAPAARRRRYAATGVATAAVAAAAAVGIGYAGGSSGHLPGARPASSSGAARHGGVHIHTAAFSVDTNPGGTVTLKLTMGQLFSPSAMRQALAKAGVPALVTVGSVCTVPGPSAALPQVLSRSPGQPGRTTITTITPSAIPVGEELSIGYFAVPDGGGLHISLVPDHAHLTCTSSPPGPPSHGGSTR
jgi:hypothetical protein